jgi:hypothetical protein
VLDPIITTTTVWVLISRGRVTVGWIMRVILRLRDHGRFKASAAPAQLTRTRPCKQIAGWSFDGHDLLIWVCGIAQVGTERTKAIEG